MSKALITFVKAPVKGTVKTRLQKDLPKEQVIDIYKSFIIEILSRFSRIRGMDRYIGCTPSKDHEFLRDVSETYNLGTFNQRGDNLGKKIVNAFRDHFKKGYSEIVLIGSDSPTIPKEYVKKAFIELKKADFVLGPCCDGGIYLIGAKKEINARIFSNIPWDTSDVLNLVIEKLYRLDISFFLLPFWYDVDNIDDLRFLRNHLKYFNIDLPVLHK
jgi:rSAM/selenodomain-associated transferase 1